jgi:hypothetical protein
MSTTTSNDKDVSNGETDTCEDLVSSNSNEEDTTGSANADRNAGVCQDCEGLPGNFPCFDHYDPEKDYTTRVVTLDGEN